MIGVTITGADDAVRVADLLAISAEYPLVEWGILMSATREGTPRYPSKEWMLTLSREKPKEVMTSAHLCGTLARRASRGEWLWPGTAQRFQLNGVELPTGDQTVLEALVEMAESVIVSSTPILQCPAADELEAYCAFAARIPKAAVLYDPSGGRGLSAAMPVRWPTTKVRVGFAGGITPDNVLSVLSRLAACAFRPAWIDMESGVRTNDRLDLDKVRRVLRAVEAVNRWLDSKTTVRAGGQ